MEINNKPLHGHLHSQHNVLISIAIATLACIYTNTAYAVSHEPCSLCHLSDPPAADGSDIIQPLPDLCISCHPDRTGDKEHIINIPPSGPIPGTLPLLNGLISCTTCHDYHGSTSGMLRIPGEALCLACHKR
jgi:predicted CXXCH cytochrome family protein